MSSCLPICAPFSLFTLLKSFRQANKRKNLRKNKKSGQFGPVRGYIVGYAPSISKSGASLFQGSSPVGLRNSYVLAMSFAREGKKGGFCLRSGKGLKIIHVKPRSNGTPVSTMMETLVIRY